MTLDRARYALSEQENERIFRRRIVPQVLGGSGRRLPAVVFVAGQTGAGKSALASLVTRALTRADGTGPVSLNLDIYKPYHPEYDRLLAEDDTTAGAYTSIDGHKWMEKAEAYVISHRLDAVMESAMRDPRDFEEPVARFRDAGYRVEVAVLAVHEACSRLGALERYLRQVAVTGAGRLIDRHIHDACYRGVFRSADGIDTSRVVHSVFALRRDAYCVYSNHLDSAGQWVREPGTAAAIALERNRAWTRSETHRFACSIAVARDSIRSLAPRLRESSEAELRDILDLASPLRHPQPGAGPAAHPPVVAAQDSADIRQWWPQLAQGGPAAGQPATGRHGTSPSPSANLPARPERGFEAGR